MSANDRCRLQKKATSMFHKCIYVCKLDKTVSQSQNSFQKDVGEGKYRKYRKTPLYVVTDLSYTTKSNIGEKSFIVVFALNHLKEHHRFQSNALYVLSTICKCKCDSVLQLSCIISTLNRYQKFNELTGRQCSTLVLDNLSMTKTV